MIGVEVRSCQSRSGAVAAVGVHCRSGSTHSTALRNRVDGRSGLSRIDGMDRSIGADQRHVFKSHRPGAGSSVSFFVECYGVDHLAREARKIHCSEMIAGLRGIIIEVITFGILNSVPGSGAVGETQDYSTM